MKDLKELSKINPSTNISPIEIYNYLPEVGTPDTVEEAIRCVEAIGNVRKNTPLYNNVLRLIKEESK